MVTPGIPTARLVIDWPSGVAFNGESEEAFNDYANEQIAAKAAELVSQGERPAFEVWYRGVPGREDTTAADFDAVEVAPDGTVITLPPYSEIEAAGS